MISGTLIKILSTHNALADRQHGEAPCNPREGASFIVFHGTRGLTTTIVQQTVKLDNGTVMFSTRNSTYVWVPDKA